MVDGAGPYGRSTVLNQATGGAVAPATQDVNVKNASIPVTGTFWQTTQPISGTVSVGNFPAIQQIADNGGSLTTDTPQLPATIGAKTAALSLSTTPSTDGVWPVVDRASAAIATGQVQVNNTAAVQVVPARAGRRSVTLAPSTQFTYFVGNAGVTITTGFAVLNGGAVTLHTAGAVFVIANASGPMTFLETF